MTIFLDFEKPVAELETRILSLEAAAAEADASEMSEDVARLRTKADKLLAERYAKLSPGQKAQVARHPARPHFRDHVALIFDEFVPLAGDRAFADDKAIIGGFARVGDRRVVVIGHEKGDDTASRITHNFGMAKPEGYRKAVRLMQLADRSGLPVITLVDTPGAFPGIEAEERGQAEAIARSTQACLSLGVPMVAAITGEGGSGGAIALAAANRVLMYEHAIYSVISPEGCASILWRTGEKASEAAEAMRITARDLEKLGIIDGIVAEPLGGAHRDHAAAAKALRSAIIAALDGMLGMDAAALRRDRQEKFLAMGRLG